MLNVSAMPESKDASWAGVGGGHMDRSAIGVHAVSYVQPPPPPQHNRSALHSQLQDLERSVGKGGGARRHMASSLKLAKRY